MTEIQNIKPVLIIEKLRFEICLEFGAWNLGFNRLYFWKRRLIKSTHVVEITYITQP
jgi:hypothetical protein